MLLGWKKQSFHHNDHHHHGLLLLALLGSSLDLVGLLVNRNEKN